MTVPNNVDFLIQEAARTVIPVNRFRCLSITSLVKRATYRDRAVVKAAASE